MFWQDIFYCPVLVIFFLQGLVYSIQHMPGEGGSGGWQPMFETTVSCLSVGQF